MDLFKICIIVIFNINNKQSGPTRENTQHDLGIYIKNFFHKPPTILWHHVTLLGANWLLFNIIILPTKSFEITL